MGSARAATSRRVVLSTHGPSQFVRLHCVAGIPRVVNTHAGSLVRETKLWNHPPVTVSGLKRIHVLFRCFASPRQLLHYALMYLEQRYTLTDAGLYTYQHIIPVQAQFEHVSVIVWSWQGQPSQLRFTPTVSVHAWKSLVDWIASRRAEAFSEHSCYHVLCIRSFLVRWPCLCFAPCVTSALSSPAAAQRVKSHFAGATDNIDKAAPLVGHLNRTEDSV